MDRDPSRYVLGVICRRAADQLLPGAALGYSCEICSEPLQVSPMGVEHIQKGRKPYCNDCGFRLAGRVRAMGAAVEFERSDQAEEQLRSRKI